MTKLMQLSYFHYFCIYVEHGMYFLVLQYSIQRPHYVIQCTFTDIVNARPNIYTSWSVSRKEDAVYYVFLTEKSTLNSTALHQASK